MKNFMRLLVVLFASSLHSITWASSGSPDTSFQATISTVITVITIIVALITFGITLLIPIALRVYRRFDRTIRRMDVQVEMVRQAEDLLAQYEIDTHEPNTYAMVSSRYALRKCLQDLINPPAHDIVASQRLACSSLAQLITNPKLIWLRKLKSLIRFMRVSGLLSNELLRSKEYKNRLIEELKDIAEDDDYDKNASRHSLSETIFKDFVCGFLVLLSILLVLALIVNGGEVMTWLVQVITTWLIQIIQVIDGLVGWLIKVIKDML